MRIRKQLQLLLLLLLTVGPLTAAETGQVLSDEETDTVLQGIFDRAAKLKYLSATMITVKRGGIVKGTQAQYAEVKMAAPARLWMRIRGDSEDPRPESECSLMLFDGEYLWEMDPVFEGMPKRTVSRRQLKTQGQDAEAAPGMAVFLLGQDVKTPSELRKKFDSLRAVREPGQTTSIHVTLTLNKGNRVLDVWFHEGGTVPWKVRTTETKRIINPLVPGGGETKATVDLRMLKNVRTNLDGLPPFPPETFVFPYAPTLEVRDDKSGEVIPPPQLKAYLDALQKRFAEDAREPTPPDGP